MNSRLCLLLVLAICAGSAHAWKCNKLDGTCLDKGHVCFNGLIHRCPTDCDCHNKWPCKQRPARHNGGNCPLKNYRCIDDSHFCLAGIKMACARGTWCRTTNNPHISPCNLTKPPRQPHHKKCLGEGRCVGKHGYCKDGKIVACGRGWECMGHWGPCVCPAE